MTADVIVEHGRVARLRLNRPDALHALTLPMVRAMADALNEWELDDVVQAVIIDHAAGRGFCAGGDVAFLRRSAIGDGGESGRSFFHEEYRLNTLLMSYRKPVVAFMDGVTMGGGVGISLPASHRVATENTRLAMPEVGIGLFPDVGGGWHLSRLPHRLGRYLALTGQRLGGGDCLAAGLATHHIPNRMVEDAKLRIKAEPAALQAVLDGLASTPEASALDGRRDDIARLFASDRLETIFEMLAADPATFASETLATMRTRSPLSMKIALRQLAEGERMPSFADNMAMEYRISSRLLLRPDFAEGVRALLIDKDNAPRWDPAIPDGVDDTTLDDIFAPLPSRQEWTPL